MKTEKRAQMITDKISKITSDESQVISTYRTSDSSVQAELRLRAEWTIRVPVDEINSPRDLSGKNGELWSSMWPLTRDISKTSELKTGNSRVTIPISAKTKTGPERRTEAKNLWLTETGTAFLSDYRAVTGKRHLAEIRNQITDLQSQQKALIPKLRESNSIYLAGKKTERGELATKNAEALKSGKFWEADKDTLKGYFHPPFDKNYLADVSEKWRAALFCECESVSYKRYSGDWGHKLTGTGRGYLCGIDDNGDEWGHRVENLPQSHDQFGDAGLDSTVEEAMENLFDISKTALANCQRQGDLLFCSEKIPGKRTICDHCGYPYHADYQAIGKAYPCGCYSGEAIPKTLPAVELHPEEKWIPRESHEITSISLQRNGRYFKSDHEITVLHTSHPVVMLPPGEYRLYALKIADAD